MNRKIDRSSIAETIRVGVQWQTAVQSHRISNQDGAMELNSTYRHLFGVFLACLMTCVGWTQVMALDVVRDGQPVATIIIKASDSSEPTGRRRGKPSADRRAAEVLVDWVRKMSGAELPIGESPPKDATAIYVGAAAIEAGLTLDTIDSTSREGLRVKCVGRRLLLAGQNDTATIKSACRLLEHWGCRYYMDHPLGEVFPQRRSLSVEPLDIREKPGMDYRHIWGSKWSGETIWKIWNGHGGIAMATGHAWGNYVSEELFSQHPEYFRMKDGQRVPSDWYCTSNTKLRSVFARGVLQAIEAGRQHPSLSPPDGRGYCQCEACVAQDDPHSFEPSSGHTCVTNRYVDFYQDVAKQVRTSHPESILSFYCYADYTQAPTSGIQLESNLCAWIAPIRYCRFHRIGDPGCSSRWQLKELLDGWADCSQKMAYRTYNYNLAECCVPFSKLAVWQHDIPYLAEKGCIGINLETLANWQIYGPHIYLSIRLAYDPQANAAQIMDEYYQQFYGPRAGPLMREYWSEIDRAFVRLRTHTGSFYALHRVYTPEFLQQLTSLIDRAAAATRSEQTYSDRVAFTAEGLKNAQQYIALRDAMNDGDMVQAKRTYDQLLARSESNVAQGQGNHYTVSYLKRFVGTHIEAAAAATAHPHQLLQVLPDQWRIQYNEDGQGLALGYEQTEFDDRHWTRVATYSDPLDAQRIPDRQTVIWYRTSLNISGSLNKPSLFFTEVDGDARVWVNGREVGSSEKKRKPFQVGISGALVSGRNTIAVRVDHQNITDLFLGGIIRPVLLID